MKNKLYKLISTIKKGEKEGSVVSCIGLGQLRALGFPVKENNAINMLAGMVSFEGSFDGFYYFTVNTPEGRRLEIPVKAVQEVIVPPSYLGTCSAILPLKDLIPFYGLITLRPVIKTTEVEDRVIELWFDANFS